MPLLVVTCLVSNKRHFYKYSRRCPILFYFWFNLNNFSVDGHILLENDDDADDDDDKDDDYIVNKWIIQEKEKSNEKKSFKGHTDAKRRNFLHY